MNERYPIEYPQFFTATILEWKPLLKNNVHKDIIIHSLRFLVNQRRVNLFAFVIMSNHIHLIWQMLPPFSRSQVQHSFMKFTAQQIKFNLQKESPALLSDFYVNAKDRIFQFWERNPLTVDLFTDYVLEQKIDYIHDNPVKAGFASYPEDYHYSSASFYETGIDRFHMLTNIYG